MSIVNRIKGWFTPSVDSIIDQLDATSKRLNKLCLKLNKQKNACQDKATAQLVIARIKHTEMIRAEKVLGNINTLIGKD